ncbi:colicin D domain-containing protein [Candidatus Jidaibacter acanthamoebae]|uniref:colicin D domain-containing protein n=1 Tax=Candidatus Jidaibacter acanthamoebae TaxID=86105 RepID=UPI000A033EE2|nr:colicin D domain-containing protein [Candidatus Jidaibacter acanthamoeba]
MKQDDIIVIAGTHRGTEKVIHYFDEKKGINVMKDLEGNFVSGWKLHPSQIQELKDRGNIR